MGDKKITFLFLFFALGNSAVSYGYDSSEGLRTTAHFLTRTPSPLFGDTTALEALDITARSVRSAPRRSFHEDGWLFGAEDPLLREFLGHLTASCFANEAAIQTNLMDHSCMRSHLLRHQSAADAFTGRVADILNASFVLGRHELDDLTVACRSSEHWVLFGRTGQDPQNMHYDTVASERQACENMTANPRSGYMNIRVWLPIFEVRTAPLLIANTTSLYPNACPRRVRSQPGQSPSWKIFSKTEFEQECAQSCGGPGTCNWFHTMGMKAGEFLAFRNGMVMHGTASHGDGAAMRISLAVDCSTSYQSHPRVGMHMPERVV